MIPDHQIIDIVTQQYPEVKNKCDKAKLFNSFENISAYAQQLLEHESYFEFKSLCAFLNQLYYHSTGKVKICIDNIFLYKISNFTDLCCNADQIRKLLPDRMRMLMQEQHGAPGI
jgi:hypothetical protein